MEGQNAPSSWMKLHISISLNIVGDIWDNVSAQPNKIYYKRSFIDILMKNSYIVYL